MPGDSLRCGYCLTEVRDIEADTPVSAPPRNPSTHPLLRSLQRGLRRAWALPKWLLLLALVAVLTGGWCGYGALKPERTLALPAAQALSLPGSATFWPSTDGDNGHTRRTEVAVRLQSAHVAWETDLGVTIGGASVADAERLYLTTVDNRIVALKLTDGSVAWTFEEPAPIGEAPIVADGRLYVLTRSGSAVALDAATGAELWRTRLDSHFYNSPALADGVLYAFGTTRALYGLDSADGHLLWTIATGSEWATLAPLVIEHSVVVATANNVNLYDRVSGALTLQHPHSNVIGLAYSDGALFSVSSNFIARVDPTAHLPWWWGARGVRIQLWVWGFGPQPPRPGFEWSVSLRPARQPRNVPPPVVYAPTFDAGLIVVANADGTVRALDATTGAERWSIEAGVMTGAPVRTPDGILLPLRSGLSLRASADGSEVATFALPNAGTRSTVVTATGTYLVDRDGRTIALR